MRLIPVLCACMLALSVVGSAHADTHEQLTQQVRDAENGFAATMAKRDHKAFATFIAEDAVFFGGENTAFRGKKAVVDSWKGLYEKPDAPFSWRSESVEVIDSGKLAHSSGPVFNREGRARGHLQFGLAARERRQLESGVRQRLRRLQLRQASAVSAAEGVKFRGACLPRSRLSD